MRRRTTSVFVAVTAAGLLLAGCGSGEEGKEGDDISGADKAEKSPSAKPSDAEVGGEKAPEMTFPKDFKAVLDWEKPTDPKKAVILDSAANYALAIQHGVVKQDADDPVYKFYSAPLSNAQSYAKERIEEHIKAGWTLTGTDRYTRPEVRTADTGKRAAVTFCQDQSNMYGKKVKTGKVLRTEKSDKDYYFYTISLKPVAKSDLWQAESVEVQGEATQCKG